MSWADIYIEALDEGRVVSFRPRGNSMSPKINSGDLVTLIPVDAPECNKGDIVLCKVKGRVYLHLVKAVKGDEVLIGNNKGHVNGWTRLVYGIVTTVERK